ncbi:MAG: methylmalonyl-CoA mutase [Deltaproteobacteria bacterium]|nr:methylmalonyl-CoA mutase [Deltaproteobacteria bacterium]
MRDDDLPLAADFPARDASDWARVAEAALKGKPLAKLTRRTYDDLPVAPLYTAADAGVDPGLPGQAPFTRGARAAAPHPGGWAIRQRYAYATPERVQAALLLDLEGGVNQATVVLDAAARHGDEVRLAPARVGVGGAAIHGLADLQVALHEVREDLAPVRLDAGPAFMGAAALMMALWQARGRDPATHVGSLGADPLGALATDGRLFTSAEEALAQLGRLAAHAHAAWPRVRVAHVDAGAYVDAGATPAQELGMALATGLAYLRAMAQAGLPFAVAASKVELTFSLGPRVFDEVAKLRAARRLWARLTEALGVPAEARGAAVHGRSARRALTRRDPWVNMLRATAAGFAGAVGGAETVELAPFDEALGLPTDFGRRMAKNTQVILQEESGVGLVRDPAGGAWFVERHTDALARAAWAELQAIEGAGGVAAALSSGFIAARIDEAWARRAGDLATRKLPVTGVSEFPNLGEAKVEPEAADLAAAQQGCSKRMIDAPVSVAADVADAVRAAGAGAALSDLSAAFTTTVTTQAALPVRQDASAFEALRDASDAALAQHGARPRILLVNIGPIAQHTARATWAKNFFEAGGVEAIGNDGLPSPEAAAAAVKAAGATLAVLCSSDELYATEVARYAPAVKAAGVTALYLAGHPGDRRAADKEAGVDGFVHVGCDAVGVLQAVLTSVGAWS